MNFIYKSTCLNRHAVNGSLLLFGRIVTLVAVLALFVNTLYVRAQCTTSVVPPTTVNGVNVTGGGTGSIQTFPTAFTSCGTVTTPANSVWLGPGGAFNYTFTFSQPVNNVVVVITGTGANVNETFTITTSAGTPTLTALSSCFSTISGNVITSGAGATANGGGGYFRVSTTNFYTTITVSGPGGDNGSQVALCGESFAPPGCSATTLFVDASIAVSGDGTSWATAFKTLDEALLTAHTCPNVTTINITAGVYKPTKKPYNTGLEITTADARDVTFHIRNGLALYGGFPNGGGTQNVPANATILSGDIDNNDTNTDGNNIAETTTDIQGNNAYHVVLVSATSGGAGGTLDGVIVTAGNANGSSTVSVNSNNIGRNNGAGIYIVNGSNTVNNNTLSGNLSSNQGGGVYSVSGTLTLTNNTLSGNTAFTAGGVYAQSGTSNAFSNNAFSGNTANGGNGGGVFITSGSTSLTNNTFSANAAAVNGGGISTSSGTNTLTNNLFWNNQKAGNNAVAGADYNAGGVNGNTFTNCLLQLSSGSYPVSTAIPSGIGAAAAGNIFAQDPLFVNAADIDGPDNQHRTADDGLRLQTGSPAVNTGNNTGVAATDITGATRIQGGTVDIGAYEGAVAVCPNLTAAAPAAVISSQSTCTGCALSGGVIAAPSTPCPAGSTLQYSTDNGSTWGTILPTYNQSAAITVLTRCNCNTDTNISSPTSSVTTSPGTCTPVTAGITNNTGTTVLTCSTTSISLTATGGTGYAWSGGLGNSANATVTTAGTYTVTVTGTNGCTATAAITITGNATPPSAGITNNTGTTVLTCSTTGISLTATGGSTYVWSGGLGNSANATVTTAGTYTVTVTGAGGCTATASVTITGSTAPPGAAISGNTTYCTGSTINLTAAAGGTAYAWSGPGGYTQNGPTVTRLNATTAMSGTYTVTVSGSVGCSSTGSVSVTVNAAPVANITAFGPTVFCSGGSVLLTASGGNSYQWSNGLSSPSITAISSGIYTVTVTDGNGCTGTAGQTVTVNPVPSLALTALGATTFCQGGSVSLKATAAGTFVWSTGSTSNMITVTTSGTYTVTVTNSFGCTNTASQTVTVNPLPLASITASGATSFCAGGSVTLTANGGTSYSWNTGTTGSSLVVNASGTYVVTVTSLAGCTATASRTVTVNPAPTAAITASGATTFCAGGSVTLTASGGGTYQWSTGAGVASITTGASGTYTVTVTNSAGCTATASRTVTVTSATASITASGPTVFCSGGSVTLTAGGGGTYLWSTGSANAAITATSSDTYKVTVTASGGCTATASQTVTVNTTPVATAGNNGPLCAGSTLQLTASGGTAYVWSGPGGFASTSQNPIRTNTSPTMSGTYTVTVSVAGGCTATASTAVTINAKPVPIITGNAANCANGTISLTASGGANYSWSGPGGYTATGATITRSPATSAMAGMYYVTVTNSSGCTATASISVTVSAAPAASVSGTTTVCQGGSIVLTGFGGTTYAWLGPDGYTGSGSSINRTNVTVAMGGLYTVTVTGLTGCTATASKMVTVNPAPAATAGSNNPVCVNGILYLTSSGGVSYSWTGPSAFSSTVQNPNRAKVSYLMAGTYTVTVTGTNGCTATANTTVSVVSCKTGEQTDAIVLSAYPNPTNGQTTVLFTSLAAQNTTLRVYDVVGKEVAVLFNQQTEANTVYELPFDTTPLPSGTYYTVLQTESGEQQQIRLIVVR
ncbi:T9SS C-terminal target domain-containing protein [Sphingobacteriales bacterium UPWRP_1]|nr:hypothetical protein BVG80_15705 [Sphingobacteriales bacterium TSM_CSM]PSJ73845.1 T9SS C-terminal target domain-containing protein [Sphingobacteriales bacterium UPWRP_1]